MKYLFLLLAIIIFIYVICFGFKEDKILQALTFVVSFLTLIVLILSSRTDLLKRTIPIEFGFLHKGKIVKKKEINTGDPAKPIEFRLKNKSETTLNGVVLDIRFLRPLALSGSEQAMILPNGVTKDNINTGPFKDKFYLLNISDLKILGDGEKDLKIEFNTRNITPDIYQIEIKIDSTQQDYKCKKTTLSIIMK